MFKKNVLLMAATISLAACGGGDEPTAPAPAPAPAPTEPTAPTAAFMVQGSKIVGSTPSTYTACVETESFIGLPSTAGQAMQSALVKYYALTTPLVTKSKSPASCKDMAPRIDQIISLSDYNTIILPAVSK